MKCKRRWIVLLSLVLVLSMFGLTGCGTDNGALEPGGELDEQTYNATLFFSNEEYVAIGDESLEKYLVYEREFSAMPGDAYFYAVEMLRNPPEEGYSTSITDKIKFNDIYMAGDTVYVDLDSNGLNGGSLEEAYLIGQVVNTLINTFAEVQQVQFVIDGEVAESLMGHIDASSPFTKDVFDE
ncbi:MAG: GerMN domain-containing protein [Anaerovoracaceae bacterium]|nr:GerMN domain-containing protein [Clostridiales bacterium]